MRVERLIAVRYLFARKQRSVVNIISWISLVGLMVSTAALIIVLSVYNGIGELTKSLFNTFDPELVIEPSEGKTFRLTEIGLSDIVATEGVAEVVPLASESAWMTYGDQQAIVTLRGVGDGYHRLTGLDTLLNDGHYQIADNTLIVGGEIFYRLGMKIPSALPAAVHIPKRGTTAMGLTLDEAFNIAYAYPVANFFIQQDIDNRYVVTDITLVRRLMNYAPDECTSLALRLEPGANPSKVKKSLNTLLLTTHSSLTVKDRYDQQPLYFKIFRTERLGIYLILSLIVLISTLSLVASLSLLIINKHDDIFMLKSMGMTVRQVRRSFLTEGLLICAVAVAAGLLIGFVVCFLQQHFGLIRMGNGNFVVEAFPVAMRAQDFLWTFLLVMLISTLSVTLTVRRARI
jgi:lipoprotein-releasing system permease protein